MDDATFEWASDRLEELNYLCASDNLSLNVLQEKVNTLDAKDIQNISRLLYIEDSEDLDEYYPLLHTACQNKNVTLEIVKYLIDTFPNSEGKWSTNNFCPNYETMAYPLHLACCNENCPSDLIRFLVEHYPPALKQLCLFDEGILPDHEFNVEGLPLHYYLARNSNIDIDIVKLLVEAYPQSLLVPGDNVYLEEEMICYPIHALLSNEKTNNIHTIVEYLLEYNPTSLRVLTGNNETPLHFACNSKKLNQATVEHLFNAWPQAISMRGDGILPIHALCHNNEIDDSVAIEILHFLLNADPTLVRDVVGEEGNLPIHFAVEDLYPESINVSNGSGRLPIHLAAVNGRAKTVELLLKHDPNAASKKSINHDHQQLPLHLACWIGCIEAVQVLYDAYPEAMFIRGDNGATPLDVVVAREERGNQEVVNFLQTQLVYARKAQDTSAMTTPDEEGYLPIHRALLQGDASLGSIKLLVRGNTAALQVADQKGVLPLPIACRNATVGIVKFLADSYDGLDISDTNKDYPLHYACRAANLDVIKYLMGRNTSRVSTANNVNNLPFHLLIGSENEQVRDSLEFTEACFLLLRAHPEAVMMQTTSGKRRQE